MATRNLEFLPLHVNETNWGQQHRELPLVPVRMISAGKLFFKKISALSCSVEHASHGL